MVESIEFAADDAGKKTTINTNLEKWWELCEDIYDILVSESRCDELAVPWEALRTEKGAQESRAPIFEGELASSIKKRHS